MHDVMKFNDREKQKMLRVRCIDDSGNAHNGEFGLNKGEVYAVINEDDKYYYFGKTAKRPDDGWKKERFDVLHNSSDFVKSLSAVQRKALSEVLRYDGPLALKKELGK